MEASQEKYIPALNLWMNSIEMVTATLVIKTCLHFWYHSLIRIWPLSQAMHATLSTVRQDLMCYWLHDVRLFTLHWATKYDVLHTTRFIGYYAGVTLCYEVKLGCGRCSVLRNFIHSLCLAATARSQPYIENQTLCNKSNDRKQQLSAYQVES